MVTILYLHRHDCRCINYVSFASALTRVSNYQKQRISVCTRARNIETCSIRHATVPGIRLLRSRQAELHGQSPRLEVGRHQPGGFHVGIAHVRRPFPGGRFRGQLALPTLSAAEWAYTSSGPRTFGSEHEVRLRLQLSSI